MESESLQSIEPLLLGAVEAALLLGVGNTKFYEIKGIGEQAGTGELHPHMLRHTYLTRLYNVEKELRFVQDQAGYASLTITAIYTKTNNTARRRQVEALD